MSEYDAALRGTEKAYPPISERGADDEWFEDLGAFDLGDLSSRVYPPLGPYDNREVVSALRKEIKLGRTEQALYWLTVMIDMGDWSSRSHRSYIARQLWIVAGEDLWDQQIVLQAKAVFDMVNVASETDHLYQLVYRMTKAARIHDHPDGQQMDELWCKAHGEIRRGTWRKVPSYAVDQHTYRGAMLRRKGVRLDQRFNGTTFGRFATRWLWRRDRDRFGPRSELGQGFWVAWAEYKLMGGEGLQRPERQAALFTDEVEGDDRR
jgi:hypothetical protein